MIKKIYSFEVNYIKRYKDIAYWKINFLYHRYGRKTATILL